ncbi:MAG: hypothetical protein WBC93_15075 [Sulfitobacter sp.]
MTFNIEDKRFWESLVDIGTRSIRNSGSNNLGHNGGYFEQCRKNFRDCCSQGDNCGADLIFVLKLAMLAAVPLPSD